MTENFENEYTKEVYLRNKQEIHNEIIRHALELDIKINRFTKIEFEFKDLIIKADVWIKYEYMAIEDEPSLQHNTNVLIESIEVILCNEDLAKEKLTELIEAIELTDNVWLLNKLKEINSLLPG